VGVAALEGSLTMSLSPETTGLLPELDAQISPEMVDVILAGPLPSLYSLTSASVRLKLSLEGLEPGSYQVTPFIDLLPDEVQVESILPETVLVTILPAPTPTPTLVTPVTVVPSPTPQPTATP